MELQEASLADITYLFEQGALVDFEVDELVNLVPALLCRHGTTEIQVG